MIDIFPSSVSKGCNAIEKVSRLILIQTPTSVNTAGKKIRSSSINYILFYAKEGEEAIQNDCNYCSKIGIVSGNKGTEPETGPAIYSDKLRHVNSVKRVLDC